MDGLHGPRLTCACMLSALLQEAFHHADSSAITCLAELLAGQQPRSCGATTASGRRWCAAVREGHAICPARTASPPALPSPLYGLWGAASCAHVMGSRQPWAAQRRELQCPCRAASDSRHSTHPSLGTNTTHPWAQTPSLPCAGGALRLCPASTCGVRYRYSPACSSAPEPQHLRAAAGTAPIPGGTGAKAGNKRLCL